MKNAEIRAKVDGGSLGTRSARAARRSIPDATARRIVSRARGEWAAPNAATGKSKTGFGEAGG
jgi:hypothetical protein